MQLQAATFSLAYRESRINVQCKVIIKTRTITSGGGEGGGKEEQSEHSS